MATIAASLLIIGLVVVGYVLRSDSRSRLTPVERARRDYLLARERVDAAFQAAKHRMEEVTGMRRKGERRMSDTFGSWRDML